MKQFIRCYLILCTLFTLIPCEHVLGCMDRRLLLPPLTIEDDTRCIRQQDAENAFYDELYGQSPRLDTLRVLLDNWLDTLHITIDNPPFTRYHREASDGILLSCGDRNKAQKILLEAIICREIKSETALFVIVGMLIDLGADSRCALETAVEEQKTVIASLILSKDPDAINFQNEWTGATAIILAAQNNDLATLRSLINPRYLSVCDVAGAALMEWPQCPEDVFSFCIQPFFDLINVQDRYGNTALMYAAQDNNYHMVKYLLQCGADKSIKNKNNEIAADCTVNSLIGAFITNYEKQN
jgi:hypothetical protein